MIICTYCGGKVLQQNGAAPYCDRCKKVQAGGSMDEIVSDASDASGDIMDALSSWDSSSSSSDSGSSDSSSSDSSSSGD